MSIDDFGADLRNGNLLSNPLVSSNESERDGNSDDLLLRIDQSAGVSITGPTTITSATGGNVFNPAQALADLTRGNLTPTSLVWLVIVGAVMWFLLKKAK